LKNFLVGTLFGIVIATIGFGGVAKLLDRGVDKVKEVATEQTK
jgi:hypothetical protein